jgi:hypothetical protein
VKRIKCISPFTLCYVTADESRLLLHIYNRPNDAFPLESNSLYTMHLSGNVESISKMFLLLNAIQRHSVINKHYMVRSTLVAYQTVMVLCSMLGRSISLHSRKNCQIYNITEPPYLPKYFSLITFDKAEN